MTLAFLPFTAKPEARLRIAGNRQEIPFFSDTYREKHGTPELRMGVAMPNIGQRHQRLKHRAIALFPRPAGQTNQSRSFGSGRVSPPRSAQNRAQARRRPEACDRGGPTNRMSGCSRRIRHPARRHRFLERPSATFSGTEYSGDLQTQLRPCSSTAAPGCRTHPAVGVARCDIRSDRPARKNARERLTNSTSPASGTSQR